MEHEQNLIINILPFTHPVKEKEFAFYTKKQDGFCPIHKGDLKGVIEDYYSSEELEQISWLYTDFQSPKDDSIVLNVDLEKCIYFGNHYYRHLLRSYFKGVADVISTNFTNEIEVWFKAIIQPDEKFTVYNQFTLKVQHSRITDGPELVVSFDGTTKVLNQSLKDLVDFPTEELNWINCNGKLHRYKYMPPHFKQDLDKLFPVISNKLKPAFHILFDKPTFANRYPKYKKILEAFYNEHLKNDAFREIIPVSEKGFLSIPADSIQQINKKSNKLLFGREPHGVEPKTDLLKLGPYKASDKNNVRFFFIYKKTDKETAVKLLYNYFIKGFYVKKEITAMEGNQEAVKEKPFQVFPDITTYIHQPLHIDTNCIIEFDSIETAIETVDYAVRNQKRIDGTTYMAIYISPISKLDKNTEKLKVYYRIKEILLQHGITSQAVYKDNIFNKSFNLFLPNIEVAILAKLGGIPWRLDRSLTTELIVGIGAFYSTTYKSKYLASAFCFNNEGIFENFNCFPSNDTDTLAGSIRKAVLKFLVDHEKADRVIIHFYKDISKKEMQPIVDMLHKLGLPIPVIIVTINKTESKGLLAFDLSSDNLMPYSGTIIKVGKNEYLLFNNTRYDEKSKLGQKEYHFPIKISFSSSMPELLENPELIEELMDQVYQFSRMYWKSVSLQSLPVTICYPEMVAEIFSHFAGDTLPPFGEKNLWFL